MKHLFIVNPVAGKKGSTEVLLRRIERLCEEKELDAAIHITRSVGDACQITRAAAEKREPLRVYACGGDGTLNEVVNGAVGFENVAVSNVPKGTGNDFLKIFGKDALAQFSDLAALMDGPQSSLDLMDCNGKLGVGVVCIGVDARIAADVHKYKGLPLVSGKGAYILALLVNVIFKGICRPVTVDMGSRHLEEETTILCVCNGRYYGGGFMPVGEAQPDDGILDMLVVKKVSLLTFFKLLGTYAKGRYRDLPDFILEHHGTEVALSSQEEIVAVVDGEIMRDTQFRIRLSSHKINFFYPPTAYYRGEAPVSAAAL